MLLTFPAGLTFWAVFAAVVSYVSAYSADATFYQVDADFGACGQMHHDNEYVVALGHGIFDTYPGAKTDDTNHNPICNKTLKATYQSKSVVVKVVDRCGGCKGKYDTDFSPTAFSKLADKSVGRINLEWEWTDLPLGPVGAGAPSTEERRSIKSFGRRKSLDPAPAHITVIGRAASPSQKEPVGGRPRRRYLTQAERGELSGARVTKRTMHMARSVPSPKSSHPREQRRRLASGTNSDDLSQA